MFATYPTAADNTPLPTGVTNVNKLDSSNNSAGIMDRFWIINLQNYTVKPTADLEFKYSDNDFNVSPNDINEGEIGGLLYDTTANSWYTQNVGGGVDTVNNTVKVFNLQDELRFGAWSLGKNILQQNPIIDFEIDTIPSCLGQEVCFFNISSLPLNYSDTFYWEFNGFATDFTNVGIDTICYTADSVGVFPITLCWGGYVKIIATGQWIHWDTCITHNLTVIDAPHISFTYTPNPIGCGDSIIQFAVTTIGDEDDIVEWTISDTSFNYNYYPITSYADDTLTINFANPAMIGYYWYGHYWGTYNILAAVSNYCGTDTFAITITIPAPGANFSSDAPVCFGDSIHFTNLSECYEFWHWDFGDGTSSTLEDPVHLYNTFGTHNVTLTINSDGADTTISVTVHPPPTDVSITGSNNTCDSLATYFFSSFDTNNTYGWGFDLDTITTIGTNDSSFVINWNQHTGEDTIFIIATNTYGCSDTSFFKVFECCSKTNYDYFYNDTIITSNLNIDSSKIIINGYFEIANGNTVTWTTDTVYLGANAKIIVNAGSKLDISKNCILLACDTLMWDGIYANYSTELYISSSTLQEAKNAVVVGNNGIFRCNSSTLRNNFISVIVGGAYTPNNFAMYNDSIYCDTTLLPQSPPVNATRSKYGIKASYADSIVIGDPSNGENYFQNMDIGIKCYNSNVTIYNNKFEDIEPPLLQLKINPCAAIYSTTGIHDPGFTTALKVGGGGYRENEFKNCTNGIYSLSTEVVRIERNTFEYPNNGDNRGTAIQLAEFAHPAQADTLKRIYQNTIDNYLNGIMITNLQNTLVQNNHISNIVSPYSGSSNQRSYGIHATGCYNLKINSENIISNDTATDWRIEGITINNCPSSYITCNIIENMGRSMFIGGSSAPSIIQKNEMDGGVDGFFLNGVIGTQGGVV